MKAHKRIILNTLLAVALIVSLASLAQTALAVSPNIVISQVYGGGGNTGATYTHDFIELFNRGTTTVSLAGWSVQYASATGTGSFGATSTQITELPSISLAPGQYLLIREAQGTGGTIPLPTPDVTDSSPIAMSATGGKVALVNAATPLGCNGGSTPCSPAQLAQIVDLVGYGNADFFEGADATPAPSNTTAVLRAGSGCFDTDNNSADFAVGAPTPRNTASPLNPCSGPMEPKINEFSASTAGTDVEYVEIFGTPNTDYSAYTVLEIEGDGSGSGVVDEVISVGSTDANGFWLGSLPANALENGTLSLLLVNNFTGALNSDLDTNNDGTFDATPWDAVVDAVAVNDGTVGDLTYGVPSLGPNYDGLSSFAPGGASRYPDGFDTDAATDWVRNDFDLAGIPGFTGTPVVGEALNTPGAMNELFVPPPEMCGDPVTHRIFEIQGSGLASPLVGMEVAIEAIVVGDFQNNAQPDNGDLNGFHVQEEDAEADGDPSTSDGIFVFAPGSIDVSVGDKVRVRGTVTEFNGLTEIGGVSLLLQCSTGNALPAAATVNLPVTSLDDFERYEGMRVTFPQALVISEYFNYERFGEMVLALPLDGESRPFTPTAIDEPGPPALARALANSLRRITLDDGLSAQNPDFVRHPNGDSFALNNRFRGGDTVQNTDGVMDFAFGLYRIQPTGPADYKEVNPRPAAPEPVGGSLRVAAMNTLNFFLTPDNIQEPSSGPDNPADNLCGPVPSLECRGWDGDQPPEFTRQRDKLLSALVGLDADIIGLNELENTTGVDPLGDPNGVVAGLNHLLGPGTYAYINTGVIGTDAIRVGLIYRPGKVAPVGGFQILDSADDPRFLDTKNRPALAQTFEELATGARFTVVVNHLKSKGSDCNDVGDPDTGDGQGNCNQTRKAAAEALVDWLATDPTGSGDPDFLIIGDLNSYAKEDPIDAIQAGADDTAGTGDDYTNLIAQYQGTYAYSYVFDGQSGYLDHALANPSLAAQVTGAADWHINADEPDLLDYDTSFKPAAQEAIYEPNAYRSSDHDPVIVGLNLTASRDYYLHGAGATANPPTLFLDDIAPTGTTAKYKDSASIKFSGGNPWKDVGTWAATPASSLGTLITLSDVHAWLGLKNSDDQGTRFDLRVEVYKNGVLAASGETYCITGVTRNPSLAQEVGVSFGSPAPVSFDGTTDVLSLKVLTRIGTNGSGSF